jgi:hypothetical protein
MSHNNYPLKACPSEPRELAHVVNSCVNRIRLTHVILRRVPNINNKFNKKHQLINKNEQNEQNTHNKPNISKISYKINK